jgi:cobalt/nickel transport system permease protein
VAAIIIHPSAFPDPSGMHIPDGFLNAPVAGVCWAITVVILAAAVWRTNRTLTEKAVPLMGVMAAFIFAAQMINFPVAGGTSGHLLGGTLAAILVGPWAGIIVMASVLGVQGLIFQDGGLAAMGANILNMGIIGCLVGYAIYAGTGLLANGSGWPRLAGAFAGAWLAVMTAAVLCSIELGLSDTSPYHVALPAMTGVHAIIGAVEGFITAAAVAFVMSTRRDLLEAPALRPVKEAAVD